MKAISTLLQQLLHVLPIIILVTIVETFICFSVAALALLELMPKLGRDYPYIVFLIVFVMAIFVQVWILFNHKIRSYIKARS